MAAKITLAEAGIRLRETECSPAGDVLVYDDPVGSGIFVTITCLALPKI